MIDDLELEAGHAEAIIEKAIEFEVYTDEMPKSKKDKMEAAHEIIAFAIDTWVSDEVRPDSDDEDEAKAGQMIVELFEIAGVEIDDDGEVTYGDPAELDGDNDDDGDGDDDGEAAFDIEDIIEGYEELTAANRVKKIKALELDPDEDEDYNTLVGIAEWEEAQDKPSSRVLDYLNDVIPPDDGDDDDKGSDDDADGEGEDEPWDADALNGLDKEELAEVAGEFDVEMPKRMTAAGKKKVVAAILEAQEEADNDGDGDGDDNEEPWEGYDDASVKDIKAALEEAQEDDDDPLTVEQVEMVIAYEEANEERKPLIKWLNTLLEGMSEGDDDDNDDDGGEEIEITEEALNELDNDDLKEVAAQYEIEVTGRLTAAKRKKLIAEIIEAADDGEGDDGDEPEAEEEKPAGRSRRGRGTKSADPDEGDDADEAKAKDDRKDAKKGKGGTLILTRAQILAALEDGEVEIELG